MVAINDDYEKVDLVTTDRNLEDLMLKEYCEPLLLDQIVKETFGEVKLYIFKDLTKSVIDNFLENYSGTVTTCSPEFTGAYLQSSFAEHKFLD